MNVSVAGNGVDEARSTLGLSLGMALLCGNQALSHTNQQLLEDGLISPLVFELLERQGGQDAWSAIRRRLGSFLCIPAACDRLWSVKTPKELLINRRFGMVLAMKSLPSRGL